MKHLFIDKSTRFSSLIIVFIFISFYGKAQFAITPVGTAPFTGTTSAGPITVHTSPGTGVYLGHGLFSTNQSTAVGGDALSSSTSGSFNTAIGYESLRTSLSGNANSAVGAQSLKYLTSGDNNNAFGYGALQGTTTGRFNVAMGSFALINNTSENLNTAIGFRAGYNLGVGGSNSCSSNTFIGSYSGDNGSTSWAPSMTGFQNVAVGDATLNKVIIGNANTAIGPEALPNLNYGSQNVGIGYQAKVGVGSSGAPISYSLSIQNVIYGINMQSGAGNVGIAVIPSGTGSAGNVYSKLHVAGSSGTSPSLQLDFAPTITSLPVINPTGTGKYLFLDAYGIVSQAPVPTGVTNCGVANYIPVTTNTNGDMICSQIYDNGSSSGVGIGTNTGFTYTGTTITGQIGPAPTSGSIFKLVVNGTASGTAFIALSDKRLKKEIKRIENPLTKISKINGYTYFWNKEYTKTRQLDDNKQAGFLAQEILNVLPEAVIKSEDGLYGLNYNAIMPLLAEGIKEQQSQIEKQQIKIEDLETKVKELSNKLDRLIPGEVKIKEESFDITPNPITGVSTVSYKLSNATSNSYLAIYDLQGKLLKKINIAKNANEGQVQIRKTDFGNGMYILSLVSNNAEVQSKKFIISQ